MDYPVKVRIELGPGWPSKLQPLKEPDGHKAMLGAIHQFLTMGNVPAGHIAESTVGDVTASASLGKFGMFMDPPPGGGNFDTTVVSEYHFTIRLKGPEGNSDTGQGG